ncbi:MAG TPA: hypothetical protein VIP51_16310 [Eoetvoesiella sp.]
MQTNWTELAAILGLVLIAIAAVLLVRRHKSRPTEASQLVSKAVVKEIPISATPTKIIIGEDPAVPVITIQACQSLLEYEKAIPLDIHNGPISRLSALLQAAPSVLIANEAAGKQLMEVVVSGDLVRAADGNGFRAFVMGAKGIKEHARLFDVANLQNMINAAAIWQVASVVVAQKHLADISKKLDDIKESVKGISQFLDNQRKSRIEATLEYLYVVYGAVHGGELSSSTRGQLENCECTLLEIQIHSEKEYRQKLNNLVLHKETFGTGNLATDISNKIAELDALAQDLSLCIKTRIVAWHLLSLHPGEPGLKLSRRSNIQRAIDSFHSLEPYFSEKIEGEISKINAIFNSSSTLAKRREKLSMKAQASTQKLARQSRLNKDGIGHSDQLMLKHDRPNRLLFEFDGRVLVGAREVV